MTLDLTGQTFGKLTAIKDMDQKIRIECGFLIVNAEKNLFHGQVGSLRGIPLLAAALELHPQLPAYKVLFAQNHYQEKGLLFDIYMHLVIQNCYYCNSAPKLINPLINRNKRKIKAYSDRFLEEQWILYNGIDKYNPTDNYTDISNLVPCCSICNFMKGKMRGDDFIEQIKLISEHYFHESQAV